MVQVQTIVNALVELHFVRDEKKAELLAMTVPQLMKDYVLPHCLCLPRTGVRYPRISGSYMKLMTKYGKDFLEADYELGSVLLEMAMQRITKHPDLPAIDYRGILPDEYKPYSAASINSDGYNCCPDEPGLWGSEEVHFLVEMLPTCLALRDAPFAKHAQTILFQLLTELNKSGYNHFSWLSDPRYCDMSEQEVWQAAVDIAHKSCLTQIMIDRCVEAGWRCGKRFFKTLSDAQLIYLVNEIDLEKEVYYTGIKRGIFKLFGLYNQKTKERIVEEIR